jgi:carboxymethylenebutenolidase
VLAAVTYPDRRDGAAVVVITARDQKLTPWLRAIADQITSEGFIAVVPDVFSGNASDLAAVRQHIARHPAANGVSAGITVSSTLQIDTPEQDAQFAMSKAAWPAAVAFLNTQTKNDRRTVVEMPTHAHPPSLQAPAGRGQAPPRGYPGAKLDHLPAGLFTAKNALLRSSIKAEWVEIPMPGVYSGRMRTRITYPDGTGTAGVVVVMQHGPGADEWMQALGDQLSRDGFIALVPDLHTGMGRNGGGYETFSGPDDAFAANANLRPATTTAAYKAVREFALRLPRANGKSAALGFCMGGSNAWLLAADVEGLNGAVVYYGTHPADEAVFARIKAPVIGFYGEDDARVTSTVAAASTLATKLGKRFEPHVYAHATHGFLEFQDLGGNPQATADSWSRTVAFLRQQLK